MSRLGKISAISGKISEAGLISSSLAGIQIRQALRLPERSLNLTGSELYLNLSFRLANLCTIPRILTLKILPFPCDSQTVIKKTSNAGADFGHSLAIEVSNDAIVSSETQSKSFLGDKRFTGAGI